MKYTHIYGKIIPSFTLRYLCLVSKLVILFIWIFITVRGDVRWRGRVSLFKRRIYVNVHIIKILKYCRLSIPSGFKRHVFESTFISLCRCWFDSTRRYIGKDLIDVFNPDLKLGTVSCLRSSSSIIGFLHSFFFKKEKFSIVPRSCD